MHIALNCLYSVGNLAKPIKSKKNSPPVLTLVTGHSMLYRLQGNHILIDREDRKSQLRTFKEGIAWLQKGVSVMAFPESMRSPDGRLMELRTGLFALAVKTNVPIVPITLSNTHAVMPAYSFFPIQYGAGKIHVHIGEAMNPEGKTEAELEVLVRQEIVAHLPSSQLPALVAKAAEIQLEAIPFGLSK